MLAFEIIINGEEKIIAGSNDLGVLSAHVTASGNLSDGITNSIDPDKNHSIDLDVGGLDISYGRDRQYHVGWIKNGNLKEGDEITIRIIETNEADEPIELFPANRSIREEFERMKELRESLKISYEMMEEPYELWHERMEKIKPGSSGE